MFYKENHYLYIGKEIKRIKLHTTPDLGSVVCYNKDNYEVTKVVYDIKRWRTNIWIYLENI